MATVLGFLKNNWMVIAAVLVVIALVLIFLSMKKEKYYDYEMTGCSTCSAGDAGVFDYEMYQMPDDYYSDEADAEDDDVDAEDDGRIYEEEEIYNDDTFVDDDAENSPVLYEDMYADGYDAKDEAMAVAEDILATGFDEEEDTGMNADMIFAKEVMDGGIDGEDDDMELELLDIDELDAEEDDYSEL
jgi:hypothetical protein